MKTEYTGSGGFLQRDGVEHKEYAEVYSAETQKAEERDGADLLEKVLDRDNLNRAYRRVKANKGASGVDGITVDEALPWLKEHREELLESIRNGKYKPSPVRRVEIPMERWNEWLRRRIRMYIWKQWKKPRTRVENLKKLGMPGWQAYRNGNTRKSYWAVAGSGILTHTITNERLARRGYYDISEAYKSLHCL